MYLDYAAASDLIASEGGANPERLEPYVAPELFAEELESFKSFASFGLRQIGVIENFGFKLQNYSDFGDGLAVLTASACADYTGVTFVNASNEVVTPSARPNILSLAIELIAENGEFRVSGLDPVPGKSKC